MSVLPIYLYGTQVLRKKAHPVEELDDETVKLIYDMFETMRTSNGIGLAATQVGSLKRVIVVDISDVETEPQGEPSMPTEEPGAKPQKLVMINPTVVSGSGLWSMEEGCLSIPNLHGNVERAEEITVRYRDGNFRNQELTSGGLMARVILHEIDHLDGVLFIDRMAKAERALLRSQLNDIKSGTVETSYPVVTAPEE